MFSIINGMPFSLYVISSSLLIAIALFSLIKYFKALDFKGKLIHILSMISMLLLIILRVIEEFNIFTPIKQIVSIITLISFCLFFIFIIIAGFRNMLKNKYLSKSFFISCIILVISIITCVIFFNIA